MKKRLWVLISLVFFFVTVLFLLPCQAQETLQACAKIKKGTLRIVSNASECKKSEYAVTLNGTVDDGGTLKGEYCWNFVNETLGTNGTIQLGCSHIGNNHHVCSGIVTVPPNGSFPTYGNAEIVGGQIYATYSLAGMRNGIIGNDMSKAVLDPITLDGTFTGIGVYWDDSVNDGTAVIEITDSGTLTNISCN